MTDAFKVCKTCRGLCCRPDGCYLTRNEARQIEAETGKPCLTEDHGRLLKLRSVNGACQFLSDTGCVLKHKPIACEIYPFLPTRSGWVVRMACPHLKEITDAEFMAVKDAFANSREWVGYEP